MKQQQLPRSKQRKAPGVVQQRTAPGAFCPQTLFNSCVSHHTKSEVKRNGNLRYTTRPIQEAVEQHEQKQLRQLELDTARWRAQQAWAEKSAG